MVYCNPLFCCVGFHRPKKNGSGFFAIAAFFAFVGRKKNIGKSVAQQKHQSHAFVVCFYASNFCGEAVDKFSSPFC